MIEAGRFCLRALGVFRRYDDPHYAEGTLGDFLLMHKSASPREKRELEDLWTQAGPGPFPPQENS